MVTQKYALILTREVFVGRWVRSSTRFRHETSRSWSRATSCATTRHRAPSPTRCCPHAPAQAGVTGLPRAAGTSPCCRSHSTTYSGGVPPSGARAPSPHRTPAGGQPFRPGHQVGLSRWDDHTPRFDVPVTIVQVRTLWPGEQDIGWCDAAGAVTGHHARLAVAVETPEVGLHQRQSYVDSVECPRRRHPRWRCRGRGKRTVREEVPQCENASSQRGDQAGSGASNDRLHPRIHL